MKKEELLKFYQDYRIYIFPLLVALSSLVLIVFVIYPQISKLIANQQIKEEISSKSSFLEVKAQVLDSVDQVDLERKVDFALRSFPADKDFASVLGLLQALAAQSGFSIISAQLGAAQPKGGNVESYTLRLDLLGSNTSLLVFLSSIENSTRIMRVSSIEVSPGRESQGATVSINVEVLYSSAPKTYGSLDSPLPELDSEDEEIIARLAGASGLTGSQAGQPATSGPLGPRGKSNPFE